MPRMLARLTEPLRGPALASEANMPPMLARLTEPLRGHALASEANMPHMLARLICRACCAC